MNLMDYVSFITIFDILLGGMELSISMISFG